MRFQIDHDLHIHSQLSTCSQHPEQTNENLLRYAKEHGLRTICLTNHFWDSVVPGGSDWYAPQNYEHLAKALPLPQDENVTFYFGCETDLNRDLTLGISKERFSQFDFVIIPTTHLHMNGFTIDKEAGVAERADAYVKRLDKVLSMDLPFHKIGLAHLACRLIMRNGPIDEVLNSISDQTLEGLFKRAAELGVGIELNGSDFELTRPENHMAATVRLFTIAKEQGCKFYLGSDSHKPEHLEPRFATFERAVTLLNLTEDDKYHPAFGR